VEVERIRSAPPGVGSGDPGEQAVHQEAKPEEDMAELPRGENASTKNATKAELEEDTILEAKLEEDTATDFKLKDDTTEILTEEEVVQVVTPDNPPANKSLSVDAQDQCFDGGVTQAQVREEVHDYYEEQSEASKLAANKPKKKVPPDITTDYTKVSPDTKSQDIQANMYPQSTPTRPEITELADKQGADGQGPVDVVLDDEGGGNQGDDSREHVQSDKVAQGDGVVFRGTAVDPLIRDQNADWTRTINFGPYMEQMCHLMENKGVSMVEVMTEELLVNKLTVDGDN
jgi:hypothetical protein